jgi:hypothetical protein
LTVLQIVGLVLVVAGVVEFLLFRYLAPRRPNIARRITLLNLNSLANVVAGFALLVFGG